MGEGGAKGVTGASFGQSSINVRKFATIVLFTDEQIEDLQNGDLNVLVDAGVRQALSVSIDAHAAALTAGENIVLPGSGNAAGNPPEVPATGSVFDSAFFGNGPGITIASLAETGIQTAVSAALGVLEENGYGNPDDIGVLLGFGFQKALRDVRSATDKRPLYDGGSFAGQSLDALYGLDRAHSTNLTSLGAAALTFKPESADALIGATEIKATEAALKGFPLVIGQPISGEGIAAGTVITGLTAAAKVTTIKLSKALTAESKKTAALTVLRPVGVLVHKPNVHVRIRQDVIVKTTNEATIVSGGETRHLFQENLTGVLYETRLGVLVHDAARATVPLFF